MWPNPQKTADLVAFTEEILNGKLQFLCRVSSYLIDLIFLFAGLISLEMPLSKQPVLGKWKIIAQYKVRNP